MQKKINQDMQITETMFLILATLTAKTKHANQIAKDIEKGTSEEIQISHATLYRSLRILVKAGLIAEDETQYEDQNRDNHEPRHYKITRAGMVAFSKKKTYMETLIMMANNKLQEGQNS